MPRHTVRATQVWRVCQKLLSGASVKSAVETTSPLLALETIYHLLGRLRLRLDVVRSWLCRREKAPPSEQTEPLLQTMEHLESVFKEAVCPVSEFQSVFQQPFMG